ncbi:MAG: hypothetical protein QOI82_521 [Actinomycetota bacterium]|jgi:hypothetical protein|nr:hypothetical protein [Actinomycetota bacterium]
MPLALPLARIAALAGLCLAAAAAAPSGAATAAFGTGTPGFVVSAAPESLSNAANAGEPSLGVSWKSGNALFMSLTSTYKLRFDDHAQPPTVTWSDVSSPYSLFNIDPILATDPASGVTLAGGDDGACAVMSRTSDDGESWSYGLPCTLVVDHPSVAVGPLHGGAPGAQPAAYFCQQYPSVNQCAHSADGGATWTPSLPGTGCYGLFGHLKVAADGTVYAPSKNCSAGGVNGLGGFVSRDNGTSWSSWVIPGAVTPERGFDPSVAAATDGTLYETWARNGDAHPVVAVSSDGSAHWTKPVDLADSVKPALTGATFTTMVAGGPGRAAVAFLGTRHQPKDGTVAIDDVDATWDLFVATTYDGGTTWTTTQVTSDPVQRGAISDGGVGATSQRNLLDFMDAGVTREGRVIVAFADGCTAKTGCTSEGAKAETSTEDYATVAYQSVGRGLFAQYDQ